MSNEVTISNSNNNFPSTNELQAIQVIARTAQASGLYAGVGGESKILMILLAAKELGIGPMMALNGGIWNIQGKLEISARCMNSMIRKAGHSIKTVRSDDQVCTLLGTRKDGDSFECTFSIEDAQRAGLAQGNVWKKYAGDMLYNRCMSRLARRLFADVIGEAYVEDEIREAKEVEAQERKLEQADCVVTDSPIPEMKKIVTLPEIPDCEPIKLLSIEQVEELATLYTQIDGVTKKNVDDRLSKMNASTWNDVHEKHFNFFKSGMENNIALNKKLNESKEVQHA